MNTTSHSLQTVQPDPWIRLPSGRFVNLAHITDISFDGTELYYTMMSRNAYGIEIPYSTENMPEDARALREYMEQHTVTLADIPEDVT